MITTDGLAQIAVYLLTLLVLIKPLGWYMAQVYEGTPLFLTRMLVPLERFLYRLCRIDPKQNMDWQRYLSAMLIFNLLGLLALYLIQRLQRYLPLNPQHFSAPAPDLAFNTAVSFATNTNWQSYSGEQTMSYFTQMVGLTMQNFLSAATGMSLLVAFIRGILKHERKNLGNFWVDMVRGILYILIPLSCILSLILVSQGVIQNLKPNQVVHLLQPYLDVKHEKPLSINTQIIPMGPVASQIAIKQLGTNGGGFFNVNAAHPYENPTPVTNFFEMLAILLIPASFCYTFGLMIHDKRQGWAILATMILVLIPVLCVGVMAEQAGNPLLTHLGIGSIPIDNAYPGGNMEGKETRFGIVGSAIWAVVTTATSSGSVNSMHDSYMPLGGLMPLWLMNLGEVIFGGVGSGLYGMLMLVIITVFIAGLMVGRTPEYLGKKIEPFEMKMACFAVLVMPLVVLLSAAMSTVTVHGINAIGNPGPHGLTEILYAFTSMGNNNGSAFAGLNTNTPFYNILGGVVMLVGRYWIAIPVIAIAGSLVQKRALPNTSGTLGTHTPLFVFLLVSIVILLGALSFLPSLALGPIVEQLLIGGR